MMERLERDYGNIVCSSAAVIVDNFMHSIQTHSELLVVECTNRDEYV